MDKTKDDAFSNFLEKIQGQNKAGLLINTLQLKYERETAGEDADKREEQLEQVATALENVEKAITGMSVKFDFKPVELGKKTTVTDRPGDVTPKREKDEETTGFGNIGDLGKAVGARLKGIYDFMTNKVDKKEDVDAKPEITGINPESDNIQSTQEVMAESAKKDVELTGINNDLLEQQLKELKKISAALAPSAPSELPEGRLKAGRTGHEVAGGGDGGGDGGGGLGLGDALSGMGGLAKKAGGAIVKGAKVVGKGALSLGGGIAKFAASGAGKALGATAAVGLGAYTAYKGFTAAEDSKQSKLDEVQAKVDSGEMKPEEAATARKQIGNTATVEKSGAVGEGTGMAAGAIAGGMAGAKLGAAIGSIIPGAGTVVGAGIGTIAGGALGAFAGSSAGKYVGEKVGSGINAVKGFFGGKTDAPGTATKAAIAAPPPTVKSETKITREEKVTGGPGAKNPVVASTAASPVPALPVVEKKSVDTAAPGKAAAVAIGADTSPKKKGPGPRWLKTLEEYEKLDMTPVDHLDGPNNLPGIKQRYKALAKTQVPLSDSLTSIQILEQGLVDQLKKQMMKERDSKDEPKKSDNKDYNAVMNDPGYQETRREMDELEAKAAKLPTDTVTNPDGSITQKSSGTLKGGEPVPEARAAGGPVEDGADYIVGEKGPELFMPFKDGVVLPNDVSKKIVGGKIPLAKGGIALADDSIDHYDKLSKNAKDYQNLRLQLENIDKIRGPGGANVFEDISPEVKEKEAKFRKMAADLEKEISPAEKNFVDSALTDRYRPAQSEAELDARGPSLAERYSSKKSKSGSEVARESVENSDLTRETNRQQSAVQPIISSSVNNNNTQSYVPIKPSPRSPSTGSALDRYNDRVSAY